MFSMKHDFPNTHIHTNNSIDYQLRPKTLPHQKQAMQSIPKYEIVVTHPWCCQFFKFFNFFFFYYVMHYKNFGVVMDTCHFNWF